MTTGGPWINFVHYCAEETLGAERWTHPKEKAAMLVLTRKVGERIHIGDDIVIMVNRIQGDKVRLGIEAPPDIVIHREEIYRRAQAEKQVATPSSRPEIPPLRDGNLRPPWED